MNNIRYNSWKYWQTYLWRYYISKPTRQNNRWGKKCISKIWCFDIKWRSHSMWDYWISKRI